MTGYSAHTFSVFSWEFYRRTTIKLYTIFTVMSRRLMSKSQIRRWSSGYQRDVPARMFQLGDEWPVSHWYPRCDWSGVTTNRKTLLISAWYLAVFSRYSQQFFIAPAVVWSFILESISYILILMGRNQWAHFYPENWKSALCKDDVVGYSTFVSMKGWLLIYSTACHRTFLAAHLWVDGFVFFIFTKFWNASCN